MTAPRTDARFPLWGSERWTCLPEPGFPVLAKVLDVRTRLSVQVHPGEETAKRLGAAPKNEMWCILEPGVVYAGLVPGTGEGEVRRAIAAGTLEKLLVRRETKRFETYFIPAGLVHSAEGTRFYEIQQPSDTTYRLYDWNAKGPDGKGRPLHIEESMQSIDWSLPPPGPVRDLATPWFVFRQEEIGAGGGELAAPDGSPMLVYDVARDASHLLARGECAAMPQGTYFTTSVP